MTPQGFTDDPRVTRALGGSTLLGAVDRAIAIMWRAAAASRSGALALRLSQGWAAMSSRDRSHAIAVVLLTACGVHIALMLTHEVPLGWLWLMLPGAAATIGLMLLLWPDGASKE
jgi:hypothetical protein